MWLSPIYENNIFFFTDELKCVYLFIRVPKQLSLFKSGTEFDVAIHSCTLLLIFVLF